MKTEIENIEIAQKMLDMSIKALENELRSLDKGSYGKIDVERLSAKQVEKLFKMFQVINQLRNVIAGQFYYLREISDDRGKYKNLDAEDFNKEGEVFSAYQAFIVQLARIGDVLYLPTRAANLVTAYQQNNLYIQFTQLKAFFVERPYQTKDQLVRLLELIEPTGKSHKNETTSNMTNIFSEPTRKLKGTQPSIQREKKELLPESFSSLAARLNVYRDENGHLLNDKVRDDKEKIEVNNSQLIMVLADFARQHADTLFTVQAEKEQWNKIVLDSRQYMEKMKKGKEKAKETEIPFAIRFPQARLEFDDLIGKLVGETEPSDKIIAAIDQFLKNYELNKLPKEVYEEYQKRVRDKGLLPQNLDARLAQLYESFPGGLINRINDIVRPNNRSDKDNYKVTKTSVAHSLVSLKELWNSYSPSTLNNPDIADVYNYSLIVLSDELLLQLQDINNSKDKSLFDKLAEIAGRLSPFDKSKQELPKAVLDKRKQIISTLLNDLAEADFELMLARAGEQPEKRLKQLFELKNLIPLDFRDNVKFVQLYEAKKVELVAQINETLSAMKIDGSIEQLIEQLNSLFSIETALNADKSIALNYEKYPQLINAIVDRINQYMQQNDVLENMLYLERVERLINERPIPSDIKKVIEQNKVNIMGQLSASIPDSLGKIKENKQVPAIMRKHILFQLLSKMSPEDVSKHNAALDDVKLSLFNEIKQQLYVDFLRTFKAVSLEDFLDVKHYKDDTTLKQYTNLFNNVESVIRTDILFSPNRENAAATLNFWIQMGGECLRSGNFPAFMAINTALTTNAVRPLVSQLPLTDASRKLLDIMREISGVNSSDGRRKVLRATMESSTVDPVIPHLGGLQTELNTVMEKDSVNFSTNSETVVIINLFNDFSSKAQKKSVDENISFYTPTAYQLNEEEADKRTKLILSTPMPENSQLSFLNIENNVQNVEAISVMAKTVSAPPAPKVSRTPLSAKVTSNLSKTAPARAGDRKRKDAERKTTSASVEGKEKDKDKNKENVSSVLNLGKSIKNRVREVTAAPSSAQLAAKAALQGFLTPTFDKQGKLIILDPFSGGPGRKQLDILSIDPAQIQLTSEQIERMNKLRNRDFSKDLTELQFMLNIISRDPDIIYAIQEGKSRGLTEDKAFGDYIASHSDVVAYKKKVNAGEAVSLKSMTSPVLAYVIGELQAAISLARDARDKAFTQGDFSKLSPEDRVRQIIGYNNAIEALGKIRNREQIQEIQHLPRYQNLLQQPDKEDYEILSIINQFRELLFSFNFYKTKTIDVDVREKENIFTTIKAQYTDVIRQQLETYKQNYDSSNVRTKRELVEMTYQLEFILSMLLEIKVIDEINLTTFLTQNESFNKFIKSLSVSARPPSVEASVAAQAASRAASTSKAPIITASEVAAPTVIPASPVAGRPPLAAVEISRPPSAESVSATSSSTDASAAGTPSESAHAAESRHINLDDITRPRLPSVYEPLPLALDQFTNQKLILKSKFEDIKCELIRNILLNQLNDINKNRAVLLPSNEYADRVVQSMNEMFINVNDRPSQREYERAIPNLIPNNTFLINLDQKYIDEFPIAAVSQADKKLANTIKKDVIEEINKIGTNKNPHKAAELAHRCLARNPIGLLTPRPDYRRAIIENFDVLNMLVAIAKKETLEGKAVRDEIIQTELLQSHYWKGEGLTDVDKKQLQAQRIAIAKELKISLPEPSKAVSAAEKPWYVKVVEGFKAFWADPVASIKGLFAAPPSIARPAVPEIAEPVRDTDQILLHIASSIEATLKLNERGRVDYDSFISGLESLLKNAKELLKPPYRLRATTIERVKWVMKQLDEALNPTLISEQQSDKYQIIRKHMSELNKVLAQEVPTRPAPKPPESPSSRASQRPKSSSS